MYVTTDSNGTPYCTDCGRPVDQHSGNTTTKLGKCPAED